MMTGKIEFEGRTRLDIADALSEALTRINSGNTSGFDSNDDGSFSFEINGEEEETA